MEKLRKIFRNPASDILFMIGLVIACVILINISELVSKILVAENKYNKYAYTTAYQVIIKDNFGKEAILEYVDEYTQGNIYFWHEVNIDGQQDAFTARVLMAQNEQIKEVFKEGGYNLDVQYDNAILIGQGLEKYTIEENGTKYLKIDNESYNVIGIFNNSSLGESDETLCMLWDTMSEDTKERWIESGFPNEFLRYESNICEHMIFDENILGLVDAGSLELNSFEIDSTSGGHESEVYEDISKIILSVGLVFSILTCFTVSRLWLMDRRRELSVRIAYGYSDNHIFILLFRDTMYLIIPTFVISVAIQWVYSLNVGVDSILEGEFLMKLAIVLIGILAIVLINTLYLMTDIRKFKSIMLNEER